jgi:hypothetical protein
MPSAPAPYQQQPATPSFPAPPQQPSQPHPYQPPLPPQGLHQPASPSQNPHSLQNPQNPQNPNQHQPQPQYQNHPGSQPPQSHMTVVPPPPSMSSPYGAPDRTYPAGAKPTLVDTDTAGGWSRNKRIGVIAGAAVLVVAGVGGTILALSGSGDSPKPVASSTPAPPPDGGSGSASGSAPTQSSTSSAPAGPIGGTQGAEGAKDVVLRGLYGAAADRDFKTVCTSQTVSAQKGAAKGAGWDGNGDPLPMCEKYFTDKWSTIDAGYLRGRKATDAKQGANATTMLVTVDDPPPTGNATTRTFTVVWSNNHWLLEAAKA